MRHVGRESESAVTLIHPVVTSRKHRLRYRTFCQSDKIYDRQADHEHRCTNHFRYTEIRPGSDAHQCMMKCTGWMFHNASPSNCVRRCISAYTTWPRSNSLSFVTSCERRRASPTPLCKPRTS